MADEGGFPAGSLAGRVGAEPGEVFPHNGRVVAAQVGDTAHGVAAPLPGAHQLHFAGYPEDAFLVKVAAHRVPGAVLRAAEEAFATPDVPVDDVAVIQQVGGTLEGMEAIPLGPSGVFKKLHTVKAGEVFKFLLLVAHHHGDVIDAGAVQLVNEPFDERFPADGEKGLGGAVDGHHPFAGAGGQNHRLPGAVASEHLDGFGGKEVILRQIPLFHQVLEGGADKAQGVPGLGCHLPLGGTVSTDHRGQYNVVSLLHSELLSQHMQPVQRGAARRRREIKKDAKNLS